MSPSSLSLTVGSSKADLASSQLSVVPFHASRLALCVGAFHVSLAVLC